MLIKSVTSNTLRISKVANTTSQKNSTTILQIISFGLILNILVTLFLTIKVRSKKQSHPRF